MRLRQHLFSNIFSLLFFIGNLLLFISYTCPVHAEKVIFWQKTSDEATDIMKQLEKQLRSSNHLEQTYINRLYEIAAKSEYPADKWRALFWDALNHNQSDSETADSLLVEASERVDRKWTYDYYRICCYKQHLDYKRTGNMFEDYMLLKSSADYYKSIGDTFNLADTYNKTGVIFSQLNESQLALENFTKAENIYRNNGYKLQASRIRLNIANSCFDLGEKEKALNMLITIEKDPATSVDTDFHISVLFSLTRSFIDSRDMTSYDKYTQLLRSLVPNNPQLNYKKDTHLAFYNFLNKDYKASISLYKEALDKSLQYHDMTAANCLLGLIYNYKEIQRWDSTAYYWEKLHEFNDSVEKFTKVNSMKRMESLATIKNYEQRLAIEKEQAELRQNIILISAVFVVCLLISLIIIIRSVQQKDKALKQLKESENRELQVKLENERLQNRQRQIDIEEQNRKLMMNTMMLSEKITAMKNIQTHLKEAVMKEDISPKTATIIDNYIKSHIQESQNWLSFKTTFEKTVPQFYDRLREKCPNLSEYELRLCAFIHLRMDNKTIANMLNVQPDSVKKSRQRLRKKLDLPQDTSIEDFLHSVTN